MNAIIDQQREPVADRVEAVARGIWKARLEYVALLGYCLAYRQWDRESEPVRAAVRNEAAAAIAVIDHINQAALTSP